MLIEFYCTNQSEYDAATGRYSQCGHRVVCSDDKIGQLVKCDGCNQPVEVPFDIGKKKPKKNSAGKTKRSQPAVAATKPTKTSQKRPPKRVKKINEKGLSAPKQTVASDNLTFEFEQEQIRNAFGVEKKLCPKCGEQVKQNGRCSACNYIEPKYESATLPLDQIPMKLAGMQRWFCAIFNEGVSVGFIGMLLHVLMGLLSTILLASAFFIKNQSIAIALAVVVILSVLLYAGFIFKGYQLASNPRSKLAWFQKPVWNLILFFSRKLKWQRYDSTLKGRLVIERRGEPLVDEKVSSIEGLNRCQVLDLEGTLITDKALRQFYGLTNLSCLVLRKTNVTHEGVLRLQQANPRLWIWY